jgi:hypothetical protein
MFASILGGSNMSSKKKIIHEGEEEGPEEEEGEEEEEWEEEEW